MSTMLTRTASAITPDDRAELIMEPVQRDAVCAHPALATTFSTDSTTFRIPKLGSDALASWTSEAEEITPSEVTLEEIIVTPAKVAALVPVSNELARDSNPAAIEVVGRSLTRALVDQLDQAFIGALPAPAPQGLGSLDGYIAHTTDLSNLDAIHEAAADVGIAGGIATGLLVNPADAARLSTMKSGDGSNIALLDSIETVAGLTVVKNRHVTAGEMWVLDSTSIASVMRSDVEVVASGEALFSSDRTAVRGTLRVGFAYAAPQHVAKITITE